MAKLFKGTLGRKRVIVFSSASEAADYCKSHPGYDYHAATVYPVYISPRMKKRG